ncbi:unnamed protein product, partial [Staurois parvus]
INGARIFKLCVLPGSAQHRDPVPAVSSGHNGTPIVIRDHMQSSKQYVTSDMNDHSM